MDGEFDELTKVRLLGSNDGKSYHTLSDKTSDKLIIRKPGIYTLGDNVALFSPSLESHGEQTKINVTLYARRIV